MPQSFVVINAAKRPSKKKKKKKQCCWASGLFNLGISDWFRVGLFKKVRYAVHFWKK